MSTARVILHADLDAFFASVEQLDDPTLRGKPVLVGGTGKRGVVCAASYESRPFGCRSAMPMGRARALCPAAIVVPPRFDRYCQLSEQFMAIVERFSPQIEAMSLDEAFVDVTGSQLLHGTGAQMAGAIRAATRAELGLPVSVGVAPNKFVAKLASDMAKPDGLLDVLAARGADPRGDGSLREWLAPIDIARMWGVGPKSLPRYHAAGIRTFGDLQRADPAEVQRVLGDHGVFTRELALGHDDRAVETEHEAKGVGKERTFGDNLEHPEAVLDELYALTQSACSRLRAKGGRTRRITLKIRFGDFETITRSATLDAETDSTLEVWSAARTTFTGWAQRSFQPIRLIGIRLERLPQGAFVPELFADRQAERARALDRVADAVEAKFGHRALHRGAPG